MSIDSIEKYFRKNMLSGTIGHAYLFSNTNYQNVQNLFNEIIKKYIFNGKLETNLNPDFYLIEPEKGVIKKEKIIELEQEIMKTSQTNNKKLYIINECEKLNNYSANSLLKTLEEPSKNVYAFLFTENIEKVFPTIKSRCQIIYCDNKEKVELCDDEVINKSILMIQKIEEHQIKVIAYNAKDFYKSFDKEDLKKVLNVVEYFYKDCINKLNNMELEYFEDYKNLIEKVLEKNKEDKIIRKIIIISRNLSLLEYNLNLNAFMDKLLIEIGRV